jgi:methylmalonyl-CoA mutase N-terminal domain/subunit
MDEALALPSELAVRVALRTQQIIAHESNVANTVDPLAGSYYLEAMTDRLEAQTYEYFDRIDRLGGVIPAIEAGFFQREIADAAYRYQHETDTQRRIIVGVNEYVSDEPLTVPLLEMYPQGYDRQIARLERVRGERDNSVTQAALARLEDAARDKTNLMPPILEAVHAYATLGEIMGILRKVFGEYREPVIV